MIQNIIQFIYFYVKPNYHYKFYIFQLYFIIYNYFINSLINLTIIHLLFHLSVINNFNLLQTICLFNLNHINYNHLI